MRTGDPETALAAVRRGRLLVGRWPWRSVAYLLAGLPVAAVAFAALAIPWLVLVTRMAGGGYQLGTVVALVLLGAALAGVIGPLVGPPLARLERRRLRIADPRPVGPVHRKPARGGPGSWLRARYTDPVTWREVGYACLLGTVTPVMSIAALLTAPLAGTFLASPVLVSAQAPGGDPVALGFGQVATVGQARPYVVVGLVLLPLIPYLWTLLAGGQAAVARALLVGGPVDQLRADLVEVSRSRARLADAFEAERRRIQRDLHDGAQQRLVSLTLQLAVARLDTPPGSAAEQGVAAAHEQAKQLMAELRDLVHGIQPQILTDLGLPAACEDLADRCPVPVTVDVALAGRPPRPVEDTAYYVASECLANIAKHSGATCATVTAYHRDGILVVEVGDNGCGGADPRHGTGLTGLADRVAAAGGRLLLSSPAGGPTLIRVELPCPLHQRPSG